MYILHIHIHLWFMSYKMCRKLKKPISVSLPLKFTYVQLSSAGSSFLKHQFVIKTLIFLQLLFIYILIWTENPWLKIHPCDTQYATWARKTFCVFLRKHHVILYSWKSSKKLVFFYWNSFTVSCRQSHHFLLTAPPNAGR